MTTAFTVDLVEKGNEDLSDFIHRCAHSANAVRMNMGDGVSLSRPLPLVFDGHRNRADLLNEIEEAETRLRTHNDTTREQHAAKWEEAKKSVLASYEEQKAHAHEIRDRVQRMIVQVKEWKAPRLLADVKRFALSQLESELKEGEAREPSVPTFEDSLDDWIDNERDILRENVVHRKRALEDYDTVLGVSNRWLAALHKAFPRKTS